MSVNIRNNKINGNVTISGIYVNGVHQTHNDIEWSNNTVDGDVEFDGEVLDVNGKDPYIYFMWVEKYADDKETVVDTIAFKAPLDSFDWRDATSWRVVKERGVYTGHKQHIVYNGVAGSGVFANKKLMVAYTPITAKQYRNAKVKREL